MGWMKKKLVGKLNRALILHAYTARFEVTENLEKILVFG